MSPAFKRQNAKYKSTRNIEKKPPEGGTQNTKKVKKQTEELEKTDLEAIDGELLEIPADSEIIFDDEEVTQVSVRKKAEIIEPIANPKSNIANQKVYLLLPILFLIVALLGGLRFGAADGEFLFIRPPLIALIFACVLLVLFFRANLIRLEGWFSEDFTTLKNAANGAVLITLFFASVQIFNSLLPEQGLPFWILAFCFFWTLWNNLFADFDTKKLIRSLGAMFGLAFVVKYLILINFIAPTDESWWQNIFKNMTKDTFAWILDLPRFSPATGYVQFFAVIFYLIGLSLLPPAPAKESPENGNFVVKRT